MAEPIKVALTRSDHPSTTWSPHDHADLSLPDGKWIIGTCPTEELRRQLAPFVENAHTGPRLEIINSYATALKRVYQAGGSAAVEAWWQEKRG